MKVILNEDVKGIGKKGEVVEVSDGYGRNFLLKKKKAVIATAGSIKEVEAHKEKMDEKQAQALQDAKNLAAKLEGTEIVLFEKAGTEGRLFGAVTNKEVCDELNKLFGLTLDKKKFELKETVKHLGETDCKIKIFPGVTASIKIIVKEKE